MIRICHCARSDCCYVLIEHGWRVHMDRSWTPLEDGFEHETKEN